MRIIHRISKTLDFTMKDQLASLGIEAQTGLATFEIEESHSSWPEIKSLVTQWQAVDIVTTKFTAAELKGAKQLQLVASWHHGYPEPSDDGGYLEQSFDLTNYCKSCGIGNVQSAPIRMASEPKWGKRQILQLNWIFDEFFVLPEVWKSTFQPLGVECEKVINHQTGKELGTVVQLKIDKIASSKLDISDDVNLEDCSECGQNKLVPISRGEFPPLIEGVDASIVKSQEFFGSGASAWRAVIVSPDLFNAVRSEKLKGVHFIPCSGGSEKVSGRFGRKRFRTKES